MPSPNPPTLPPPPLRLVDHAWRIGLILFISFWVFVVQMADLATELPDGSITFSEEAGTRLLVDLAVGAVTYPLVLLRRRWPVVIAVLFALAGAVSTVAAGPAMLATVSMATRRRWREVVIVAVPNIAAALFFDRWASSEPLPWAFTLGFGIVLYAALVGIGFYIGARRDLIASLRARAETAEREQTARVEQARAAERNRIAREMHDVLAHRMSVVALYAGALRTREDLTSTQAREAATVVEDGAREALTELRQVLGVLREGEPGRPGEHEPPQPTLVALDALVSERADLGAGQVVLRLPEGGPAADDTVLAQVPETVSRTGYRVVQEGLTNVRKHARGADVEVRVTVRPGAEVRIDVDNEPPPTHELGRTLPGSGLGLVGLRERASLVGGRVEAGPRGDGGFVLSVWLPWRP